MSCLAKRNEQWKEKSQSNEIEDTNNQEKKVGLASVKLRTKKVPDISEQYEN